MRYKRGENGKRKTTAAAWTLSSLEPPGVAVQCRPAGTNANCPVCATLVGLLAQLGWLHTRPQTTTTHLNCAAFTRRLLTVKPVNKVRRSADISCPVSDQPILIKFIDLKEQFERMI